MSAIGILSPVNDENIKLVELHYEYPVSFYHHSNISNQAIVNIPLLHLLNL